MTDEKQIEELKKRVTRLEKLVIQLSQRLATSMREIRTLKSARQQLQNDISSIQRRG